MSASSTNRETIRDAFAGLLSTALVGTGKPCAAVYGYSAADFSQQSPVVTVTSWNTERTRTAFQSEGTAFDTFKCGLLVEIYTLWQDADGSYTEASAEDQLDLVEKTIADTVADNTDTANWQDLYFARSSESDWAAIGGCFYRTERLYLIAEKLGG